MEPADVPAAACSPPDDENVVPNSDEAAEGAERAVYHDDADEQHPEEALGQSLTALLGPSADSGEEGAAEHAAASTHDEHSASDAHREDSRQDANDDSVRTLASELLSRELLEEVGHEPKDSVETPPAPSTPDAMRNGVHDFPSPNTSPFREPNLFGGAFTGSGINGSGEGIMDDWKPAPQWPNGNGINGRSPINDSVGGPGSIEEGVRIAQMKAQYEIQVRQRNDEVEEMRERLQYMEIEHAQMRAAVEAERRQITGEVHQFRKILQACEIPKREWNPPPPRNDARANAYARQKEALERQKQQPKSGGKNPTTLDSKMEQLNSLLHEEEFEVPGNWEAGFEKGKKGGGGDTWATRVMKGTDPNGKSKDGKDGKAKGGAGPWDAKGYGGGKGMGWGGKPDEAAWYADGGKGGPWDCKGGWYGDEEMGFWGDGGKGDEGKGFWDDGGKGGWGFDYGGSSGSGKGFNAKGGPHGEWGKGGKDDWGKGEQWGKGGGIDDWGKGEWSKGGQGWDDMDSWGGKGGKMGKGKKDGKNRSLDEIDGNVRREGVTNAKGGSAPEGNWRPIARDADKDAKGAMVAQKLIGAVGRANRERNDDTKQVALKPGRINRVRDDSSAAQAEGDCKDDNDESSENVVSTLREMFPGVAIREEGAADESNSVARSDGSGEIPSLPNPSVGSDAVGSDAVGATVGTAAAEQANDHKDDATEEGSEDAEQTPHGRTRDDEDDQDPNEEEAEEDGGGRSGDVVRGGAGVETGRQRAEGRSRGENHWTQAQVEKSASRGFEFRQRGNHWEFKLVMGGKKHPPMSEDGMGRYCEWIKERVAKFVEENGGQSALEGCQTIVDFSYSGLTDPMVSKFLEALSHLHLNPVMLKLFGNRIAHSGVLALCEFIRANPEGVALQELHLSHNDIEDDAILQLVRAMEESRPLYPPRRATDRNGEPVLVPVWLQVNHNRLSDPRRVLQVLKEEGIVTCEAWDRNVCGTGRCRVRGAACPLVHLFNFGAQRKSDDAAEGGDNRELRGSQRDRRGGDRQRSYRGDQHGGGDWNGQVHNGRQATAWGGGWDQWAEAPQWEVPASFGRHMHQRDAW